MIIDLLHNKIVKETATEAFLASVNSVLVPMITDKYGDAIERIVMYEDYLADGFMADGEWYYPLSVKLKDEDNIIVWVKWAVNKKSFKNCNPYAYVQDGEIEFMLADTVPDGFADKLSRRAIDYDRDAIKLSVEAVVDDPMLLVGKYSQTFIDEMARQITNELCEDLGVEYFKSSTIELKLVFAPGTYLEHTSENVTYRRLLLIDVGCQPRDFWIKWTRLDSAFGYKVSDNVSCDTVRFEIGEDASQKIREKEYRFLAGANPDKYQSAMGKKNVTEWRSVTKRAIKRGDLTVKTETEITSHAAEVSDKLRSLLASYENSSIPVIEENKPDESSDFFAELAKSVLGGNAPANEEVAEEPAEEVIPAEPIEDSMEEEEIAAFDFGEPIETEEEASEIPEMTVASVFDLVSGDEAEADEEVYIPSFEPAESNGIGEITFEEYVDSVPETSAKEPEAKVIDEAALRLELEAKIRLEIETEARLKAEREAEALRLERERLIEENERLNRMTREAELARQAEEEARRIEEEKQRQAEEAARLAEEERQRELEAKRAEEARIRAEIEAQMRLEARERERVAEAARLAVEEQKRLEAEKAEREARERQAAFEREAERLRREEEARRREEERRLNELRRQEEEARRRREEEEAKARVQIVTKQAKLLFRYAVDINVIKRIKAVVEETLVKNNKEKLNIHIKAYPVDSNSIALEIKLPQNENELLVSMMKALGGAAMGITKIILE